MSGMLGVLGGTNPSFPAVVGWLGCGRGWGKWFWLECCASAKCWCSSSIVFGGVCGWKVIRVLVVMTDCIGQGPVSRAGSCGGVVLVPPLLMCVHVGDRNVKKCLILLESLEAADR